VGAVTIASLTPTPYLPPQVFDIWDKAQHAGAFLLLGGMGLLAYPLAYPASASRVLLGLLAFGGGIELAQAATGWRIGDWLDWLADAIGIAAVYLAWVFWKPARSHGQISTP
jgi:VanZ family protein